MKNKNLKFAKAKSRGFSLLEIIISIAVAAVILPGIVALQSLGSFTSGQGETYTKAYTLVQEEMETIYKMKEEWDWTDSTLSYTPSPTLGFTNKIVKIEEVQRCGNMICDIGFVDPYTRKITVQVSWNERGSNQQVEVISYVTRN